MDRSKEEAIKMAQKMQGKTDDNIIQEIAELVKSGQGGLSKEKAESIIKAIQPMVDPSQKGKLQKLLNELKER